RALRGFASGEAPTFRWRTLAEAAMKEDRYHKHRLANHVLHPESLMLRYGCDPLLSEGAVRPPAFLTSTLFSVPSRKAATSSTTWRGGGSRPRARPVTLYTRASITPTARSSSQRHAPPTK